MNNGVPRDRPRKFSMQGVVYPRFLCFCLAYNRRDFDLSETITTNGNVSIRASGALTVVSLGDTTHFGRRLRAENSALAFGIGRCRLG